MPGGVGACMLYCWAFAEITENTIKDSAHTANAIRFTISVAFSQKKTLVSRGCQPEFLGTEIIIHSPGGGRPGQLVL